jgi:hypothetical protein
MTQLAAVPFIDLLCIDSSGSLVIVELKRDRTPREVTAQALNYASWVKDLDAEEIDAIATRHLKGSTLRTAFQTKFSTELPEVINEHHAMRIVASEIDDSTERIIRYLAETYGVDINAVRFQFFRKDDHQFLVRTFTVAPEIVEQSATSRDKRTRPTREKFFGALDQNGKTVFEKLLEFAESKVPAVLIRWTGRGFSLNLNINGNAVAIFYCYSPESVFKQSIYTDRAGINWENKCSGGRDHESVEKCRGVWTIQAGRA